MEQVSQAESKIRSPFKRRAGLTDEEMGRSPLDYTHVSLCVPTIRVLYIQKSSHAKAGFGVDVHHISCSHHYQHVILNPESRAYTCPTLTSSKVCFVCGELMHH